MTGIPKSIAAVLYYWQSAPWQAGFYVEARGHSLRDRIGRLLETEARKDHIMRRFAMIAAVVAVAIAGWVRVQLVAVAQDDVVAESAITTPAVASVKSPAGPPTQVPREELTYDGKRFEDYQMILAHELASDRRAEAIQALTAFASAGYAQEVAEIILVEMDSFDERRLQDARNKTLREACSNGLRRVDPQVATPLIVAAIKEQGLGTKYLALQSLTSEHLSDELTELLVATIQDESLGATVRMYAMQALLRQDDRFEQHWEMLRPVLLRPSSSNTMREVAVQSMHIKSEDSEEFLDKYTKLFVAPVVLDAAERGDSIARELQSRGFWELLRRDEDTVMATVLRWLSTPDRAVTDQTIERVLGDPGWAMRWSIAHLDDVEESEQVVILRLLRNLQLKHNAMLDRKDGALRADVVKFLGELAGGSNEELSEEAIYHLAVLSIQGQSRSLHDVINAELNKHVPDRGPTFSKMVDERLREEQRTEQEAEQKRQTRSR